MRAWLVVALLLAPVGAGQGGGEVLNTPPYVVLWSNALGPEAGSGASETLSGTVADDNLERDLRRLSITAVIGPAVQAEKAITWPLPTARPGSTDEEGWRVWDPAPDDGRLSIEYEHTYTSDTLHRWRLTVEDQDGASAAAVLDVHVGPAVRVSGDPVAEDGTPLTGVGWGGWSASPGARDVQARNYLRIENAGATDAQGAVLDFTGGAFAGVEDPDKAIPIDGNVRFAWWEGPPDAVPADGDYRLGDVSATGSVTVQFTAMDNVIFLTYQIDAMPEIILDQEYRTGFSVVAL